MNGPRLLLDENLSESVAALVAADFGEVLHVRTQLGTGATDDSVWDFARRRQLVLVTRDTDFERMSAMYGHPPKVVLVLGHNARSRDIASLLVARKPAVMRLVGDTGASLLRIGPTG